MHSCYINCPNDPRQRTPPSPSPSIHPSSLFNSVLTIATGNSAGQRDIYCSYVITSSVTPLATPTSSAAPAKSTDDDVESNQNDSADTDEDRVSTTTDTANSAERTNSAADLVLSAGRVLAAVAGAVAVVL